MLQAAGQSRRRKPRIVIVNDVRVYLNSIKKVLATANASGIHSDLDQSMDGDDLVLSVRIKNARKRRTRRRRSASSADGGSGKSACA